MTSATESSEDESGEEGDTATSGLAVADGMERGVSIDSIMENVRRRAQSRQEQSLHGSRQFGPKSQTSIHSTTSDSDDSDTETETEGDGSEVMQQHRGRRKKGTRRTWKENALGLASRVSGASVVSGATLSVPFQMAVTVPITVAMFVSAVCICVPLATMFWLVCNSTLRSYKNSVNVQRDLLNSLVDNATESAFSRLLETIDWSVQESVIAPPDRALDSLWGSMRLLNRLSGATPMMTDSHARALQYSAWVELKDQWEDYNFLALGDRSFTLSLARTTSLYVVYSNELLAGASISGIPENAGTPGAIGLSLLYDSAAVEPGDATTLKVWEADNVTGDRVNLVATQRFIPTERPYWTVQERLAASEGRPRSAWTKLYDFVIPWTGDSEAAVGLSQTKPIAYCGDYSCFEGVLAADIQLETVSVACQQEWERLRDTLRGPSYQFRITPKLSTVFIVNRVSKLYPEQEGSLIGASDNYDAFKSNRSRLTAAVDSPLRIVRTVANALLLKFGEWRSDDLHTNLKTFTFQRGSIEDGRFEACEKIGHYISFTDDPDDCMQVAVRALTLDENLQWLVVVALPAQAFTQTAMALRDSIDLAVLGQEQSAWDRFIKVLAIAVSVSIAMTVLSACLGLCITRLVSGPLKRLGKQMHRLENLDTTPSSRFLRRPGTRRLVISEVEDVNEGFVRLTRSIKGFARFVPETVVRNMVSGDRRAMGLHVEPRCVTIMFSDVKDFTSIAERLDPMDLILTLYMYLSEMTRIVEMFEGIVSEILGDGLLVFWNTPTDVENHGAKATAAALAQQKALVKLNVDLAGLGLPQLSIRIGLHSGDVLSGNIGSETKMKFGCIGDPINLASRLEGMAKYYGVCTLLSGSTQAVLPAGSFELRKLDLVQVKGKSEPIWVYELLGQADPLSPHWAQQSASLRGLTNGNQTRSAAARSLASSSYPAPLLTACSDRCRQARQYEQALAAFHEAKLPQAAVVCEALLQERPEDLAALRLLERARQPGTDSTWSPVLAMTQK